MVKKVTNDFESLAFNTAISEMMIFVNACNKETVIPKEYAEGLVKLLNPIAPHITEEMWEKLGHNKTIAYEEWPKYDEAKTVDTDVTVGVQVNGKMRTTISYDKGASKEEILELALNDENVKKHIEGKEIIKEIVIPEKIVNIVVK